MARHRTNPSRFTAVTVIATVEEFWQLFSYKKYRKRRRLVLFSALLGAGGRLLFLAATATRARCIVHRKTPAARIK